MGIGRRRNEARELRTRRSETRVPKVRLPKRAEAVLSRRIKYLADPTRYLVVSTLVPKFVLYYDVKEDVFAWNDPAGGTVFKRRAMAAAVARLLGPRLEIVQCKVDKNGLLVKRSVRIRHRTS